MGSSCLQPWAVLATGWPRRWIRRGAMWPNSLYKAPCVSVCRLITRERIGHTDAGGQRADVIEAGIRADGPARILHTGTRSGGLGGEEKRDGDAYVMSDWAGRMANTTQSCCLFNLLISVTWCRRRRRHNGSLRTASDLWSVGHGFESRPGTSQLRNNLGQVTYTYVPLTPSSIIWHWSNVWEVNRHTTRCTSPVSLVSLCTLVSRRWLLKRISQPPSGPRGSWWNSLLLLRGWSVLGIPATQTKPRLFIKLFMPYTRI